MSATSDNPHNLPPHLVGMTQAKWDALSPLERTRQVDRSGLCSALAPYVGSRVDVTLRDGTRRRFIVGKTTGWRPSLMALRSRTQRGSSDLIRADYPVASVAVVERVR